MNEIDKMLAYLKAQVESDLKKQDSQLENAVQIDVDKKPDTLDENSVSIESMLKGVKKIFGVYYLKDFALVEGGKMTLGSDNIFYDNPKWEAELNDFYMCIHPVTQKEFEDIVGINPSRFRLGNIKLDKTKKDLLEKDTSDYPVESVSWFDAIYYCNKRSFEEGLTPVYTKGNEKISDVTKWDYEPCEGKKIIGLECNIEADGYRLPTEAEWEYAARGGLKSKGYKYPGSNSLAEVAWYVSNSKDITHKVMQKKSNELDIYDMCGNVLEWCWDWHSSEANAGMSPNSLCGRGRGGCWNLGATSCDVACRTRSKSGGSVKNYGFRIVHSC